MVEFCSNKQVLPQILKQLALPADSAQLSDEFLERSAVLTNLVPAGHRIAGAEVLFKEISSETEDFLRQRSDPPCKGPSTSQLLSSPCRLTLCASTKPRHFHSSQVKHRLKTFESDALNPCTRYRGKQEPGSEGQRGRPGKLPKGKDPAAKGPLANGNAAPSSQAKSEQKVPLL